ncbi:MAG TPA: hypothetical protein VHV31_00840 [Nitrolancea sp.]|nr:hypothetical protein [Nitrolancea sp.]
MGRDWRPDFEPRTIHRELEIIKNDLHCTAVHIGALDLDRLTLAAEDALGQGLEVWLSPEMWDHNAKETREYLVEAARAAELLRVRWPNQLVLSIGTELTFFMHGIVPGDSFTERLSHPKLWETLRAGTHNERLNAFLCETTAAVREEFHGKVTYASLHGETVDWSLFDIVSVDLYRDQSNRNYYGALIARYQAHGKPVALTEFGCCTYRGAEDAGGAGWNIADFESVPPRLKGDYIYDQGLQAREVADQLRVIDETGVDAAFVFTFVQPPQVVSDEEKQMIREIDFDFDIISYSLVKSLLDRHGTTYPDMAWEPKESFQAVAEHYGHT